MLLQCIHLLHFGTPTRNPLRWKKSMSKFHFHQVAMNAFDPVEYDRWRKWKMFTYFYHDPIYWSAQLEVAVVVTGQPNLPIIPNLPPGYFGPSGLMGPMGTFF